MADEPEKPADAPSPTPPQAAADKPASGTPAEPLKAEVSRTDAPGAGVSASPTSPKPPEGSVPKPANPAAQQTAAQAAAAPKPATATKPAPAAKPAGEAHVPQVAAPTGPTEPAPPADAAIPAFITSLQKAVPGSVTQLSLYLGDWTVIVPASHLLQAAQYLRDDAASVFDYLSDLTATDWPPRAEGRFDVLYMLYSTRHRHRVRLKVKVAEHQPLASVTGIWPAANWLEREVFDMFGVNFTGHPDRRRILMPEDWQGYPQRKDYPLEGPGELLMENPIDWLKLRQAREEADIE
jgi:NADH-quinone oxidoreductase subunit C